jgi:hypothetical protein
MAFGEKLPERITQEDGKLYAYYGSIKEEIKEARLCKLLAERFSRYRGNFGLSINPPDNGKIRVGNYKISEDLKDISLIIDGGLNE